MTSERSLLLRAAMLVPLWTAVVIGLVILIAALPSRARKWDYSIYYSSALAMRQGMNPYTTDLTPLARSLGFELDKINHATDPPTFVMCFVPVTLLAPRTGFYVWTALNGFSFLLALFLLFCWTPGLDRDVALAIAALTILFPPVIDHLVWGQNKMLVLLMFVLMLR
ncbi:MAG TPA: glycosyltransferase 87 family protein, partial [Candidatus Binataceae bacterium]|nr:glycosyltransferase 87 family protein [Candidatus Binataceae bacterium]